MSFKKTLLIKANGIANAQKSGIISGVGRSTQKLISALNKIEDIPFDIKVYVDGTSGLGFDFYDWKFRHSVFPMPVKWGNEITSLEPWYRKHFMKYDLLHIPHNEDWVWNGEKFVVTIHDVFEYDVAVIQKNESVVKKWETMAYMSKGIITCSKYSKDEILKRFNIPEEKVMIAYWGTANDVFYMEGTTITKQKLKKLGIEGKYFLSISCTHPRKNVRTLMKAYRDFLKGNPQHKLVLVWRGFPEDLNIEYNEEISKGKIIVLSSVTDDNLRYLYNGASCTMFPSKSEGFGFPILESFACGTPVMTCKNTSLTEVGKDAAIYVGEDSIDEMVGVMQMFEESKYDMKSFEVCSRRIIELFTWENTAKEYLKFYQKYL